MQRHSFDPISFVLGVLVLTLGTTFLFGAHGLAWVAPVLLIGIGATFAAAALKRVLSNS